MDFLASPIHSCSFETFDDAFFDLPKEMEFETSDDFKESMSYSVDEDDDLNNGLYGVWSSKHPWSLNNNSNSMYNSNLHLDFIGGDPESAIMVNPNIVIPNGFRLSDEESVNIKEESKEPVVPITTISSSVSQIKVEPTESSNKDDDLLAKKIRTKFISIKEPSAEDDQQLKLSTSIKTGVRILKPALIESSSGNSLITNSYVNSNSQVKNDNSRLKNTASTTTKNSNSPKCGFYYQNETFYPKPAFSYSCLIAMALKNSKHGCLPVAEIYNFMCNHFPYFKTAPNGWKNSVRHNLSLNKCFEKIEKPAGSAQRKGCLWALNPNKAAKLEDEVQKWTKKDSAAIKRAMEYPEHLELLERGELKSLYDNDQNVEDYEDDIEGNEDEDTESEEPNACEDDPVDDRLSESEDHECEKPVNNVQQYPVLNISEAADLPEYNIEVDGSIYEELIGSIESEQLFTINGSALNTNGANAVANQANKKVNKFFITAEINENSPKTVAAAALRANKNDPEIYDHYDINNLLRFENETKNSAKKRFGGNRRVCSSSRIKQIKFKTWN
ncbi:uncharacterized protein LOC135840191 [Planococcus citri]|uniref:uncharacterized protein LOC135840191 n=1 Tax=Planococcus citri TaxID=170843 RepID=UPI0031FA1F97